MPKILTCEIGSSLVLCCFLPGRSSLLAPFDAFPCFLCVFDVLCASALIRGQYAYAVQEHCTESPPSEDIHQHVDELVVFTSRTLSICGKTEIVH